MAKKDITTRTLRALSPNQVKTISFCKFRLVSQNTLKELTEKLTEIVKITRPLNILITFVSVIVAAFICQPNTIPISDIILAAFAASLVMASGNIINDIYDIEIDKVNRPERSLPSDKLTINEAYSIYISSVFISIFVSVFLNNSALLIVLFSILLLFFYSIYLKRIPLLGNIVVAFLTGLVFIFGGVVVGNPSAAIVPAVFAFLINLIREIVKDMEDCEGDKKAGVTTLPNRFGFQTSKILVLIISTLLILCTLYPFLTHLYKIEYFVLVMITVNPILIFCLKKIFWKSIFSGEDHSLKNLKMISNLLKLSMVFGLIAIYFGV